MAEMKSYDIQIIPVDDKSQLADVRKLLSEYYAMRNYDPALGDHQKELDNLPGEFEAPSGRLIAAYANNIPVGCVGYRSIGPDICEMKRLYTNKKYLGQGIGSRLAHEIARLARLAGFKTMRLDTHPWMDAARHIYQKMGFKEIPAYRLNPTEGIRYFELDLKKFP